MPSKNEDGKALMRMIASQDLRELNAKKHDPGIDIRHITKALTKGYGKSSGPIYVNLAPQDDMRLKTVAAKQAMKNEKARIAHSQLFGDASAVIKALNKANEENLKSLAVNVKLLGNLQDKRSPCSITFNGNKFTASDGDGIVQYKVVNKLGSVSGMMTVKDPSGKKSVAWVHPILSMDPKKQTFDAFCGTSGERADVMPLLIEGFRIADQKFLQSLVDEEILIKHKGTAFTEFEVVNSTKMEEAKLPVAIMIFEQFNSLVSDYREENKDDATKIAQLNKMIEELESKAQKVVGTAVTATDDSTVVVENSRGGLSVRFLIFAPK